MAKKDKKSKKADTGGTQDVVEAIRSAVERTFQATAEGASSTQKRTRELVDEIGHAAARIRETIDDLKVLEELKGIRSDLDGLVRRVEALETRDGQAAKPATTAASRTRRTTAASTASGAAARPAAAKTKSTAARAKPAGTRARSTSSRSASSRGSSSGSSSSGSGSSRSRSSSSRRSSGSGS
jgi:hypothetical protein